MHSASLHRKISRKTPRLVLVGALTLITAGACSSSDSAQDVIDEANNYPLVTGINGETPPGEPTLVHTSTEVLSTIKDGQQIRVYRDTRDAGTRSPIHIHPFGGWTCVVSGQAVLYVDGAEPRFTGPGDCVNMPAMTPMSNVNPGPGKAVLLDSFATPPDAPVWRIVESGLENLGNEFATGHNEKVNPQHSS